MQGTGFTHLAKLASRFTGRAWCFGLALLVIIAWALTGPIFGFSDTWQLVINTGTTIITFLMVFLIQNTQNRDTEAIQLKLDELIHATRGAHNRLMDLEEREDAELDELREQYETIAKHARHGDDAKHARHRDDAKHTRHGDDVKHTHHGDDSPER